MTDRPVAPAPTPGMMTLDTVAARLDVSTKTVRRKVSAGELPAHRFGRLLRVSESDLDQYIEVNRLLRREA